MARSIQGPRERGITTQRSVDRMHVDAGEEGRYSWRAWEHSLRSFHVAPWYKFYETFALPAANFGPFKLFPTLPSMHLLGLSSPALRNPTVRLVDIAQGLRSFDRTGCFPRRAALRLNTKTKP